MLNKKGFTIAEVIVSFSLISMLLASLIGAMMFYRDKVKDEETKSQLWDFKNTVTKVLYDDIIYKNIVKAENCVGSVGQNGEGAGTCINLIDKDNNPHTLKIDEVESGNNKGVYILYDGTKYKLPDSDLGTGTDRICDFLDGFEVTSYDNRLYKVKTSFRHKDMDITHDILIVIGK